MPSIITVDQEDPNVMVINGKAYSLSAAPAYSDEIVQKKVADILAQLSLKDVTDNLYLSVELFYVAYNGVAGARGGSIQAEISELQSKLALLCNECIKTMTIFQMQTNDIMDALVQTYKWLTRAKEAMALKKLAHCAEASKAMSVSAQLLASEFKELQVRSTKARSNSIEEEAGQRDKQLAAEKAARDLTAKQVAEQKNSEELVSQIASTQQLYDEAKAREEEESKKSMILGITSAIFGAVGAGLGAFAAAKSPAISQASKGTGKDDAALASAQKAADDKKKQSDEAQQKLLAAKDQQILQQGAMTRLNTDITALDKTIQEKEKASPVNESELKSLKEQRDAKQTERQSAETELSRTSEQVKLLEATAKDHTEAYAAAAQGLQTLATQTGQMAAAAVSAEESVHQEKMKLLDAKLALETEKRKSLMALAEYAETLKNLKTEAGSAALSVDSLHAAVSALGKIIGTLTNASLFWDQMAAYCARMVEQGFQQEIKDLTDPDSGLTEAERIHEYRAPDFMWQFFTYLCQWTALNGLSGEYLVAAGNAQRKAVEYLQQSPTIEEAIRKAPELARNLASIVNASLAASRQASVDMEQQKTRIEFKQSA